MKVSDLFRLLPFVAAAVVLVASGPASGAIVVTSNGAMAQLNTDGLPAAEMREFSTLWQQGNASVGAMFFVDSGAGYVVKRSTTTDGGLTWTAGVDAGLDVPAGAASTDERNPVVRDFNLNGQLTGFFGTKQGPYSSGSDANNVLFRAASADNGASWSNEALVTFGASPQNLGHTGMNGFIEVFKTTGGTLRAFTAMNNITGTPSSATRLVESSDGGATWTDLGNILIDGRDNVIGANGPVFTFTDVESGQQKMGWFMFGESAHRGVHFVISSDEGLSWTASSALDFADSTIRCGDANFISDSQLRLFYYRNTGSVPSARQLWYEDFTMAGMSNIVPNNLTVPEPGTIALLAFAGLAALAAAWVRRKKA